jgi:glycosyltransferase involved in cell wall biosynthesis
VSKFRFSVLIPVYNRQNYLQQTLDSVLQQTFQDFELIVVDDGSTDRSLEILASYADKITLLQQPNSGPEIARNRAAGAAQGEYLVFLDSDDYLLPFALQTYDRLIRHFNSPPLILAKLLTSRSAGQFDSEIPPANPLAAYHYPDFLSKAHPVGISCSAIVVRKSIFDSVGGLRLNSFPCDDTDLLLKLGAHSPCIIVDSPSTVIYRLHEGNSVRNLQAVSDGLIRLAAHERQGEYPGASKAKAFIGARASSFAYRRCLRVGQYRVAAALVTRTAPLIARALWSLLRRRLQPAPQPVAIP